MNPKQWISTTEINKLKKSNIHIYRIDTHEFQEKFTDLYNEKFLSKPEIIRLNKFRFEKDKLAFFTSRFALRYLCSKYLNSKIQHLEFEIQEYGKPCLLDDPDLQFNLSHSGHLIVLAFGLQHPIGVDTEVYDYYIDHLDLAKSVFSKGEIAQLKSMNHEHIVSGFYNCWSKKESFIKAKGLGLQIPLNQFTVRIFDEGNFNLSSIQWNEEETFRWQNFNFPIKENYAAACSCNREITNIEYYEITPLIFNKIKKI